MKHNARATIVDGYRFASGAEARRYGELNLLNRSGAISALEVHPKFSCDLNGVHICNVLPDFSYVEGMERVVEDVKGKGKPLTSVYKLKKRILRAVHGIEIQEVYR